MTTRAHQYANDRVKRILHAVYIPCVYCDYTRYHKNESKHE